MILTTIGIISVFAIVFVIIILALTLVREGWVEVFKYVIIGVTVTLFDFFIEYLGTRISEWVYHESCYFVFGLVPIELMAMFFSGGVIARQIYRWSTKIVKPVRLNTVFYLLILAGFLLYTRSMYLLQMSVSVLYIAVPVGLWGILNIRREEDKISALVFAIVVAVVDVITEFFVIGNGGYSYAAGFSLNIPIVYALITLGLFGFMEKVDRLDAFLEHPLVKGLLRAFGVQRDRYKHRIKRIARKVKDKTNSITK